MRLLLIRHGEPDYVTDTLTERGKVEAALLAEHLKDRRIDAIFKSPLGRAQETASYTEKIKGMEGQTCSWLQEFPAKLDMSRDRIYEKAYPDTMRKEDGSYHDRIYWDMLPRFWATENYYLDNHGWRMAPEARQGELTDLYDEVTANFDLLLKKHGYRRNGHLYTVEQESEETLAFFCHFGLSCVLLSHLMSVSPYILWHTLGMQTSSVTEIVTEEREKGIASFRSLRIGDISHLEKNNVEPSFMGRFCEVYSREDQRH